MKELINKAVSWIKITSFKYVFEIFYLNFNNTFSDLSETAFFQNYTRCLNSNVFLPMIINYHFNVMIHWGAPKKYINKKKKRKKKKSSSNLSISLLKRTRCGGWDFISIYLGMAKKQVKVLVLFSLLCYLWWDQQMTMCKTRYFDWCISLVKLSKSTRNYAFIHIY